MMKQLNLFFKILLVLSFVVFQKFSLSHTHSPSLEVLKNKRIFMGANANLITSLRKISSYCGTSLNGSFVIVIEGTLKTLACFEKKWAALNSTKTIKAESILGNDFPLFFEKP